MNKFLSVVHTVDTEGPLNEPIKVTFQRIHALFGLKFKPTKVNLKKIMEKKINLPLAASEKRRFYKVFNKQSLNNNSSWKKMNHQNNIIFKKSFRNKYKDSFNNGWLVNWHCVDHVGYKNNPQNRQIGYHKIFDYYSDKIKKYHSKDKIHFHFHPVSFSNSANKCGNHYFSNSSNIYQILCRRIIERNWFPSVNRPGFHIERPDSHWFLEQFIPFDYANQSYKYFTPNGYRLENWEGAPKTWTPYHPDYKDYRKVGNCKRWIARCLNLGARSAVLDQEEVNKAFVEIKKGKKSILAFSNHDYRNMIPDIDNTHKMLVKASKKYKIKFKYFDARNAFRKNMKIKKKGKLKFKIKVKFNCVELTASHETFGSQPFLSIQSTNKKFYHENFSIIKPYKKWHYYFDDHSLKLNQIRYFGFASNDDYGNTTIVKIDFNKSKIKNYYI